MNQEAQILTSLLNWTVLFLSPIPDDKETELVKQLVHDAHAMFAQVEWNDRDLQNLFQQWFEKGREYEEGNIPLASIPTSVRGSLKYLVVYQIESLFERIARDLEALCRLVWIWFQWGRAYEVGNAT